MHVPGMARRTFLNRITAGSATAAAVGLAPASSALGTRDRSFQGGLQASFLKPLPPGAIHAEGWLGRQLRQQADGLTGHLDEFWPDVSESQWFGGRAEGWERAPYWLDGLVPLAWALDDAALKEKARRRVAQILSAQRADGWYAPYPVGPDAPRYDLWAILLVNKVLTQYADAAGDEDVRLAVVRNLRAMAEELPRRPLYDWGRFRWFEGLIAVYDAFERTGESWLLDLARRLQEQGFDYDTYYAGEDVRSPTPRRGRWTWEKHVVNTAMALKAGPLAWRLTGRQADRQQTERMLAVLDRYHGQAHGLFSGDETLSGRNPVQGTELCAVVEALYSLEQAVAVTGTVALADRLERVAFNALPASLSPDVWSHQYDQQVNQVQCTVNPDHMWSTNGPESNLFGLEPNYGCCTANLHQGWPKLATHLWMQSADGGLAAVAYAPCSVRHTVRDIPIRVVVETDYPFRQTIRLTVMVDAPVRFPLHLRVPEWAEGAGLTVAGREARALRPGVFHQVQREWRGTTVLELTLPAHAKWVRRYHGAVAVERGPLVYALPLGEQWTRIHADRPHRELPHGDFEVRPGQPWNYAVEVDPKHPERSVTFEEQQVGERPFTVEGAGMRARIRGRRLPSWGMAHGWASEAPVSPVESAEAEESLTLVPYGCAKVRITEFPVLKGSG